MANEPFGKSYDVGAAALSRYQSVKLVGGLLVVTTALTDAVLGVVVNDEKADAEGANVHLAGPTKAVAEGAISDGDLLMPSATAGSLQLHDGAATSTKVARALADATDGALVPIYLFPNATIQDA